jgi:head-tail adaptor
MDTPNLDGRITIEQKSVTKDPVYGSEVIGWIVFGETRMKAEVRDALPTRSERVNQGIRVASRPTRVRMRYLSGVTSDMRVTIHGDTDRVCEIVGGPAEIGGRRKYLELVVESYSS